MVTDGRPQPQPQPQPQKQWRIKVGVKCGGFNLQIQATDSIPVLPNFSIALRIRRFIFKLESDFGSVTLNHRQRYDFSSRIRRMLGKIRLPRLIQSRKKIIKIRPPPQPLIKQFNYYEDLIGSGRLYLKVLFVFFCCFLGAILSSSSSSSFLGLRGVLFT